MRWCRHGNLRRCRRKWLPKKILPLFWKSVFPRTRGQPFSCAREPPPHPITFKITRVAKDLTHEAHDKAKVMYGVSDIPVELIGFFSNREEDAGTFVHHGQTTHIHLLSEDRKSMGHLESIHLL